MEETGKGNVKVRRCNKGRRERRPDGQMKAESK